MVAAIIPAVGLGWFVWQGPGDLANTEHTGIPPFMTDESTAEPAAGILVIRGDVENGLTYTIRRGAGDTLGENEILYASEPDPQFTADVRALVSRPTPSVVDDLAKAGIRYLVLPAPYDGSVAAGLDATDGLGQAGSESQFTRTWRIETEVDPHAVDGPRLPAPPGAARRPGHRPARRPGALPAHPPGQPAPRGGRLMSPGKRVRDADVVRRRRTPRLDVVSVLALVIPLLTVGVLALVREPPVHDQTQTPALTRLTNATVVCPATAPVSPDGWLSTASGQSGDVTVTSGADKTSVPVSTGSVSELPGQDAAVIKAEDALAPGLLGAAVGHGPADHPGLQRPVVGAVVHRHRGGCRPRLGDRAGQPRRRSGRRRHHAVRHAVVHRAQAARDHDPGAPDGLARSGRHRAPPRWR